MGGNEHNGGGQLCPTPRKGRMGGAKMTSNHNLLKPLSQRFSSTANPANGTDTHKLTTKTTNEHSNTQALDHTQTHAQTHTHTDTVFECLSVRVISCMFACVFVRTFVSLGGIRKDWKGSDNVSAATPNMISK